MILDAASAGAFTAMMKPIINETFIAHNASFGLYLPLAIVGLFIVRGLATFLSDYGMARAGRSVVRDLRQAVMTKFLLLPSARFDREPVAMLVSRLNYDTEQVSQATSESIKNVITDSLIIIAQLAVMFYNSWRVSVVLVVVAPVIALISFYVSQRYRRLNRKIQEGVGQLAHSAEEALSAQQEVKIYGAQAAETRRYQDLADKNLSLSMKVEATRASASSVVQLVAAVALAIILLVAGREAIAGRMSAGAFVALMLAMMAMLPSLKRITNVQSSVQKGIAAAERLFSVLDEPSEADTGTQPLVRARGEIEFRDVGLRYERQNSESLTGISFRAAPGTVTAIVGRSGSGKSTLIRLLPRFYEPSTGTVLIDGVPIRITG